MKSTPNLICVPFWCPYVLPVHVLLSLVIQDTEATYSRLVRCVCAVFVIFISPVFRYHNVEYWLYHICLQDLVTLGCCWQTWWCINFYEPRFAVVIKKDIKAVQFKAVLVVDDDTLNTFQGHYDEVVDIFETLRRFLSSIHHLKVEFQTFCRPLASMVSTVLLTVLLNGHIGQMHKHIVHFSDIWGVHLIAKTTKALIINVGLNRSVVGYQDCIV